MVWTGFTSFQGRIGIRRILSIWGVVVAIFVGVEFKKAEGRRQKAEGRRRKKRTVFSYCPFPIV